MKAPRRPAVRARRCRPRGAAWTDERSEEGRRRLGGAWRPERQLVARASGSSRSLGVGLPGRVRSWRLLSRRVPPRLARPPRLRDSGELGPPVALGWQGGSGGGVREGDVFLRGPRALAEQGDWGAGFDSP